MSQKQIDRIVAQIRSQPRKPFAIEDVRRDWFVESNAEKEGVARRTVAIAPGLAADRFDGLHAGNKTAVLYLHGGGYVCGSSKTHRPLLNDLSAKFDGPVFSLDYRLAPESPFPQAVEDVVLTYRFIADQVCPASGIVIAGDSAGGGLAVGAAVAIRDRSLPKPGAVWAISPWADLTNTAASLEDAAFDDPIVFKDSLVGCARAYLNGQSPDNPYASPARADLAGLPPLLIQVGAREILIDDALALARAGARANVDVTLDVWAGMVHVWHLWADTVEEGGRAIDAGLAWLQRRLG